jgi:hypothetical protein
MNNTGAHPDYKYTGFSELELEVLVQNNLLNDLIMHIPDYSVYDFTHDYYKLYTKSYAPWTCNTLYPTT